MVLFHQFVAEVTKCSPDSFITPGAVFRCHTDNQRLEFLLGIRSTGTAARTAIVPFGDQFPVPSQQSIGRDDGRDIRQHFSGDQAGFGCQTAPLFIREPKPTGSEVSTENPVLLPQVRNRVLLLLIHPARDCNEQKAEWIQRLRHVLSRLPSRISGHAGLRSLPVFIQIEFSETTSTEYTSALCYIR